ncbi:hypothetical protein M2322_002170 [Rhodoblastus acidophilus]|uniref:cellulase family glycosylhydrolase n=1 Tax=Rhodoblastus acidophilus TaxID=1074 RepID=UPI00222422F5|nr:cellulase family glycosylhydrolase [Rhodoblastus acidophilus]MCW2316622.1 hypothetical protein [Rhodoblastus acidophilus]
MSARRTTAWLCLAAGLIGAAPAAAAPLAVGADCRLLKDGKPYRGVGVNYFDGFLRTLADPNDRSAEAQFGRLAAAGIPFVRFAVLPYWPEEARAHVEAPDRLFAALDRFVADAERHGLGLIPSVFFNLTTAPDVMGEPVSAWADRDSRTAAFARRFARSLAARYAGSPAIWAWEFSNEANNWSDFAEAYRYFPANLARGAPQARTPRDNYSSAALKAVLADFRGAIRAGDAARLVTTGHGLPRHDAWRVARGLQGVDRRREFEDALADESDAADLTSLHVYPSVLRGAYTERFADGKIDAAELITVAAQAAQNACKPLFLGEFGAADDGTDGDPSASFAAFRRLLDAFVTSPAPLAAAWVFDFPYQESRDGAMNMTFANSRRNRLEALRDVNARLNAPQAPSQSGMK